MVEDFVPQYRSTYGVPPTHEAFKIYARHAIPLTSHRSRNLQIHLFYRPSGYIIQPDRLDLHYYSQGRPVNSVVKSGPEHSAYLRLACTPEAECTHGSPTFLFFPKFIHSYVF